MSPFFYFTEILRYQPNFPPTMHHTYPWNPPSPQHSYILVRKTESKERTDSLQSETSAIEIVQST